jgi:hypothetical protein
MKHGVLVKLDPRGNNTVNVRDLLEAQGLRAPAAAALPLLEADREASPVAVKRPERPLQRYEQDDFIDDTELPPDDAFFVPDSVDLAEEEVPDAEDAYLREFDGMEPVHKGFYINRGDIPLQPIAESSDEEGDNEGGEEEDGEEVEVGANNVDVDDNDAADSGPRDAANSTSITRGAAKFNAKPNGTPADLLAETRKSSDVPETLSSSMPPKSLPNTIVMLIASARKHCSLYTSAEDKALDLEADKDLQDILFEMILEAKMRQLAAVDQPTRRVSVHDDIWKQLGFLQMTQQALEEACFTWIKVPTTRMRVEAMRSALKVRGLDVTGIRPELVARLQGAIEAETASKPNPKPVVKSAAKSGGKPIAKPGGKPAVVRAGQKPGLRVSAPGGKQAVKSKGISLLDFASVKSNGGGGGGVASTAGSTSHRATAASVTAVASSNGTGSASAKPPGAVPTSMSKPKPMFGRLVSGGILDKVTAGSTKAAGIGILDKVKAGSSKGAYSGGSLKRARSKPVFIKRPSGDQARQAAQSARAFQTGQTEQGGKAGPGALAAVAAAGAAAKQKKAKKGNTKMADKAVKDDKDDKDDGLGSGDGKGNWSSGAPASKRKPAVGYEVIELD